MKSSHHAFMKCFLLLALSLLLSNQVFGNVTPQVTIKLYQLPNNTPTQERLYAAGTFNNWNPADTGAQFQPDMNGILSLTLDLPAGQQSLAFKVTRGSWATVERDVDGRDVPNHVLTFATTSIRKALKIGSWADLPLPASGTRTGTIERVERSMKNLGLQRQIWIYLPPDYEDSQKNYPVLYMYDAQNLFDRRTTAFGQEWSVDESLEELFYEEDFYGLIVVGLDNSNRRACEYNVFSEDPHPFCADGSALGGSFNDFIAQELKPWVDQSYRTLAAREHTSVMGSSMGGQMALALGLSYPASFSRVFALSPSYQNQLKNPFQMPALIQSAAIEPRFSFYQDMGDAEVIRELNASALIANMLAVQKALAEKGFASEANEARVIHGAFHNEIAWAARFKDLARRLGQKP